MRIGFDARWYNESGVGTYVLGLLDAYSRIADETTQVIGFEDPRNPLPLRSAGILRKMALPISRYSVSEQMALPIICKRENIQLFHSPFFAVPQFCRCPVVATLFDLAPFHQKLYGRIKTSIIRMGYRVAARRAARIVTSSRYSAEDITRTLGVPPEKIRCIQLASLYDTFRSTPTPDDADVLRRLQISKPFVLLLGARNWRIKNLDTGLHAVARARELSGLNFEAVLAGNTDALSDSSVRSAAALARIRTTGLISNAELAVLYRHAEVFLFPSLHEGFGIPVVEAMSCGCPVVCSNAASLAEVAGDGAIRVSPDDLESMAKGVAVLLREKFTRQFWKARALRRASNFSFMRTAKETLDLYREVLRVSSRTGDLSPQGRQCQEVRSSQA